MILVGEGRIVVEGRKPRASGDDPKGSNWAITIIS